MAACKIREGGGAHFGDDLWRCLTCGHESYPESFVCPRGYKDEADAGRPSLRILIKQFFWLA